MTYKLEPGLNRIISPVVIILPDGEKREYGSGVEACEDSFDHSYRVEEIRAVDGVIEIKLKLATTPDATNWTGEEQTFF